MAQGFDVSSLRLRGPRLLVDKVGAPGPSDTAFVGDGTLVAPAQHERTRRTYGILAHVLAVGPGIQPGDINVGDAVLIDEFAGRPLWRDSREQPLWIVGDSEVMCVIAPMAEAPPIDLHELEPANAQ